MVLSIPKKDSPLTTLGFAVSRGPKSDLAKTFPSLCLPYAPISTITKLHKPSITTSKTRLSFCNCANWCLQSHVLPIRTDPTQCGNCVEHFSHIALFGIGCSTFQRVAHVLSIILENDADRGSIDNDRCLWLPRTLKYNVAVLMTLYGERNIQNNKFFLLVGYIPQSRAF